MSNLTPFTRFVTIGAQKYMNVGFSCHGHMQPGDGWHCYIRDLRTSKVVVAGEWECDGYPDVSVDDVIELALKRWEDANA